MQDAHNIHHAHLSNVEADLTAKDGAWYNMNAPSGFLDSDAQKLWLNGKLALFSDAGYELHTDAAFVDLAPSCDPKTGRPMSAKPPAPTEPDVVHAAATKTRVSASAVSAVRLRSPAVGWHPGRRRIFTVPPAPPES